MFLFQLREGISWASAIILGVIGIGAGLATFAVAWVYFRSGLEEKLTTKYKGLYEAEKADNERLRRVADEARAGETKGLEALKKVEGEKADLLLDYTQLTQLFAIKSVILEGVTGIYSKLAASLQSGEPERIRALMRLLGERQPQAGDIHQTGSPDVHTTQPPE
jgi:hypothetical protein